MSSSRTLSRKLRTFFTCIKPRFDPSIILLYIAASVEQYCDITRLNALPENEGILEHPAHSTPPYRKMSTMGALPLRNTVGIRRGIPSTLHRLEIYKCSVED